MKTFIFTLIVLASSLGHTSCLQDKYGSVVCGAGECLQEQKCSSRRLRKGQRSRVPDESLRSYYMQQSALSGCAKFRQIWLGDLRFKKTI